MAQHSQRGKLSSLTRRQLRDGFGYADSRKSANALAWYPRQTSMIAFAGLRNRDGP
jgi:hypothetical protein